MPSPEGYSPELPENINARNEAHDINEMVDAGRITTQEAGEFAYENEMEIPQALLSAPPKVTERMRQHVIAKFPWDDLVKDNRHIFVHGTTIGAIRPLWLGEGKLRSSFGRDFRDLDKSALDSFQGFNGKHNITKGIFRVTGDANLIPLKKFENHLPWDRRDYTPPEISTPIYLMIGDGNNFSYETIGNAASYHIGRNDHHEFSLAEDLGYETTAIVLTKFEGKSAKHFLAETNKKLANGGLNPDEEQDLLDKKQKLERLIKKAGEEDIYDFSSMENINGKGLFLTPNHAARYIAHCEVQGVDKSKIVPIYDWDGNLLWPTENDVVKDEQQNKSQS